MYKHCICEFFTTDMNNFLIIILDYQTYKGHFKTYDMNTHYLLVKGSVLRCLFLKTNKMLLHDFILNCYVDLRPKHL